MKVMSHPPGPKYVWALTTEGQNSSNYSLDEAANSQTCFFCHPVVRGSYMDCDGILQDIIGGDAADAAVIGRAKAKDPHPTSDAHILRCILLPLFLRPPNIM